MPPAIIGDALLWFFLWKGTADWTRNQALPVYYFLLAWMVFSKFIKLITHFIRFPVDVLLWPISVLFGWFHGGIKLYAFITLGEVSTHRLSTCLCITLSNPLLDYMGQSSQCGRQRFHENDQAKATTTCLPLRPSRGETTREAATL